jgi:integrase
VKLQAFAPLRIESFYSLLLERGGRQGRPLSAKSVRNVHVMLRKASADAERLGLVGRNAAAAAKPPSSGRAEHTTWSSDEVREFFDAVRRDRLFDAFVLLVTTVCRGEALGLRWSDVDLDSGQLAVVQTLTTDIYPPVFSPPKTARSRRVVYLDEQTVRVLREHRRRHGEERLAAGPTWDGSSGVVFCDELGRPVQPE